GGEGVGGGVEREVEQDGEACREDQRDDDVEIGDAVVAVLDDAIPRVAPDLRAAEEEEPAHDGERTDDRESTALPAGRGADGEVAALRALHHGPSAVLDRLARARVNALDQVHVAPGAARPLRLRHQLRIEHVADGGHGEFQVSLSGVRSRQMTNAKGMMMPPAVRPRALPQEGCWMRITQQVLLSAPARSLTSTWWRGSRRV